jgi:lipid-binding SYLF domain-containing protein
MKLKKPVHFLVPTVTTILFFFSAFATASENAAQIDRDVDNATQKLYALSAPAKELAKTATGVLVFPNVIKAGFAVGGQYGKGALRVDGKTTGYYQIVSASFGLQAGAQSFGYAMFFMNEEALEYLKKSDGWEVGVGPSVVLVDKGIAKTLTTTTADDDIYVFIFGQTGLMAGVGVQGSKITEFDPDKK